MDYYNFLSEVTGFDEDFLKENSDTLSIKVSAVVEFMQAFHEKLNERIFSCDDKKLCPECESPYITYTCDEYYKCNTCDHTWT